MPFVSAIILASGSGNRFGGNKLFATIGEKTVLERTISVFENSDIYNEIIVVTKQSDISSVGEISKKFHKVSAVIEGGETRMLSSFEGLKAVNGKADLVAIHDGARPLLNEEDAKKVVLDAIKYGSSLLASPVTDTIKTVLDGKAVSTPDRETLFAAATPQVFPLDKYRTALDKALKSGKTFTDDSSIYEQFVGFVHVTEGSKSNIKITYPEDVLLAESLLGIRKERPKMRIGHGYDVHKLTENRKLILGGCEIPFEKGLLGHSDADVLVHAVMDSLLGAAGLRDIGILFPDTDESFKDADSILLLKKVAEKIYEEGYSIVNIDSVICAQKPKLSPYIESMRENISKALKIDADAVNIKATTEEGLGFTGEMKGISSTAVCLLEKL